MTPPVRDISSSASSITITFPAVIITGDSAITTYKVQMYTGATGGSAVDVQGIASDSLLLTYTAAVTPGTYYRFRVAATNIYGDGPYTDDLLSVILASQVPDTPVAPTTVINNLNVRITWTLPFD
jgi:hypothetical protein